MTDQEFTSLDPPAAQVALSKIPDEAERTRLKLLYAGKRGFLVDGTGWPDAAPPPPLAPDEVRPFGMMGSVYRVNRAGLRYFALSWGVAAITGSAGRWASRDKPSWEIPVVVAGMLVIAVLLVLTIVNGKKVPNSGPKSG